MYCPKCGAQNPDIAMVCSSCSAVLTPPTAQAPIIPPTTSGMAIAALVLAILSPFTCFISAIFSIIFGIVALVKISQSKGQLKGTGLAVTGIALPVVLVVLLTLVPCLMGILFPAFARFRQLELKVQCAKNLKQIGFMMQVYANENDDKFLTADGWCDLLIEHAGANHAIFHCKASATSMETCNYAINKNLENFNKGNAPPDMVAIFETHPGWNQVGGPEILTTDNHQGEGCNVLFVDGSVRFIKTKDLNQLKW